MAGNTLSDLVIFGVESAFSFVSNNEKVTPEQMLEHIAGVLNDAYGLSKNLEVICNPFYWGLVHVGNKPDNRLPFFLCAERAKGGSNMFVDYLALRPGLNLSNSDEIVYAVNEVMNYRQTLEARLKLNFSHQPA